MYLNRLSLTGFQKQDILSRLKILNDYCDNSESLTEGEISFIKIAIPELICILPTCVYPVSSFKLPFERLVINEIICGKNKRLKSLTDLRYPPRKKLPNLDYNRTSLKGQAIFYAGSKGKLTLAFETQPQKGQLITISKWIQTSGPINMTVICQDASLAMSNPDELLQYYNHYERLLNQLETNTQEVVIAIFRFIIKAFTREVDPKNKKGYLFSALLSNMFFNSSENPCDAIYYPSVPCDGSAMNIAIKPDVLDKHFEMIEANEVVVEESHNKNKWLTFDSAICKSYNKDTLELNWENKFMTDIDRTRAIIEYKIDFT